MEDGDSREERSLHPLTLFFAPYQLGVGIFVREDDEQDAETRPPENQPETPRHRTHRITDAGLRFEPFHQITRHDQGREVSEHVEHDHRHRRRQRAIVTWDDGHEDTRTRWQRRSTKEERHPQQERYEVDVLQKCDGYRTTGTEDAQDAADTQRLTPSFTPVIPAERIYEPPAEEDAERRSCRGTEDKQRVDHG